MRKRQLSKHEIDSVSYLNKVCKAVYLMQSATEPNLFRFGGIGVRSGQSNTAIRRLGQCTKTEVMPVQSWIYLAMIELPTNTPPEEVRRLEKLIRIHLIGHNGAFRKARIDNKDLFKHSNKKTVVYKFLESTNNSL